MDRLAGQQVGDQSIVLSSNLLDAPDETIDQFYKIFWKDISKRKGKFP